MSEVSKDHIYGCRSAEAASGEGSGVQVCALTWLTEMGLGQSPVTKRLDGSILDGPCALPTRYATDSEHLATMNVDWEQPMNAHVALLVLVDWNNVLHLKMHVSRSRQPSINKKPV